jgi:hypothetical protein
MCFRYQINEFAELNTTIRRFYKHMKGTKPLSGEYKILYDIITNSQSRELGWDGETIQSHNNTLRYLQSLDFIGRTETMAETQTALRNVLQWPKEYFNDKTKIQRHSAKLINILQREDIEMLKAIQWADLRLYTSGCEIYDAYMKLSRLTHQI